MNGDGLGRNKCLSLFFVLMRGEFDELCQFPFQQRVTFTLLCPSNPTLSKHESFMVSSHSVMLASLDSMLIDLVEQYLFQQGSD